MSKESAVGTLTVLVVDDDPDVRELLTCCLPLYGVEVVAAGSAETALECIVRERPDVVVSDLSMPHMDGWEFIRRVRAQPSKFGENLPVIAFTAMHVGPDRTKFYEAGFKEVLQKPADLEDLAELIKRFAD